MPTIHSDDLLDDSHDPLAIHLDDFNHDMPPGLESHHSVASKVPAHMPHSRSNSLATSRAPSPTEGTYAML